MAVMKKDTVLVQAMNLSCCCVIILEVGFTLL